MFKYKKVSFFSVAIQLQAPAMELQNFQKNMVLLNFLSAKKIIDLYLHTIQIVFNKLYKFNLQRILKIDINIFFKKFDLVIRF